MTVPPSTSSELGPLSLDEVYFRYDGPRIFTAKSPSGIRYFAVCVDEAELSVTYLYSSISATRYLSMRSGSTPLRVAFDSPEDGRVAQVVHTYAADGEQVSVSWVSPRNIPIEWLPTQEARLDLSTRTLEDFDPTELVTRSRASRRSQLALRLTPPILARSEYPLRSLSRVFKFTQETMESLLDLQRRGAPTRTGPLPSEVIADAELVLSDVQAASFVSLIVPSSGADALFEMPDIQIVLGTFLRLLEACSSPDELSTLVEGMGPRAIGKLRELLEEIADTSADLTAYLALPDQVLVSAQVPTAVATQGVEVLSAVSNDRSDVLLADATLIGVNLRTWVFELHDASVDPGKFTGKVDAVAREQIEGLPTGVAHRYAAQLIAETSYSTLTSETKTKYRLIAITSPQEE